METKTTKMNKVDKLRYEFRKRVVKHWAKTLRDLYKEPTVLSMLTERSKIKVDNSKEYTWNLQKQQR